MKYVDVSLFKCEWAPNLVGYPQNNWHPMRWLSHSVIIFQKALSHMSTVVVCSSSSHCWRAQPLQMPLT